MTPSSSREPAGRDRCAAPVVMEIVIGDVTVTESVIRSSVRNEIASATETWIEIEHEIET
jgi:hypothetical protein